MNKLINKELNTNLTDLQFFFPYGSTLHPPVHLLHPPRQTNPQLSQPLRPPARRHRQVPRPLPRPRLLGQSDRLVREPGALVEKAGLQVVLFRLHVFSVTPTNALKINLF